MSEQEQPRSGGSYLRQKDGSLVRQPPEAEPAPHPATPEPASGPAKSKTKGK